MSRISLFCLLFFTLALVCATPAKAVNEKIDPQNYICAELVASNVSGQPPLFEGLQLDGYTAAKMGEKTADPRIMQPILIAVSDSCAAKPTDKVIAHWREVRKQLPIPADSPWRADKTTCKDYADNPDDGSGFLIWLDGYNRGKNSKAASVLESDEKIDAFLEACKKRPEALMLDVMAERVKSKP